LVLIVKRRKINRPRTVVWFSCGASSAVAAKLALAKGPCEIVYTDPGSEHEDNLRFLHDCEEWFDQEVTILKSDRYKDTWDVFEQTKFLAGPEGARCTAELKRRLRNEYKRPTDRQIFGYTFEEKKRAADFVERNPGEVFWWNLIEMGLTKSDCLAMIDRAGIKLPIMYDLGYDHNNCIGCVKGKMGYWNKIRVDFPETFDRMARLERTIGHAINSEEITEGSRVKSPIFLDELDPKRGNFKTEPVIQCGPMCEIAEETING
jgi:3'-phosphoadenosine 5'-phosphosulfate sulfotransferase (PAPS reductase)/FAD synthetase